MMRRLFLVFLGSMGCLAIAAPAAHGQSLVDWLRGRRTTGIVNVYVPAAAPPATVPPAIVPPATAPVVTSKPVVVYSNPPIVTSTPAPTVVAPAAPVVTNPAARGYTVQYRAQTRYRSTWVRVPVTVYRPTTAVDPLTGAVRTSTNACTTYTWQVRRVPVVQYKPIRVFPGPPPANSGVPSVTVPASAIPAPGAPVSTLAPTIVAPAPTVVPTTVPPVTSSGWTPVAPATTVPATTLPSTTLPSSAAPPLPALPPPPIPSTTVPSTASPSTATPSATTPGRPFAPQGDSADIKPRIDPSELQKLETQKPEASRSDQKQQRSKPATEDRSKSDDGHGDSNDGEMKLDRPSNGRAENAPTGYRGQRRPVPIPRIKPAPNESPSPAAPAKKPATQRRRPKTPAEVDEPPSLLDPNDRLAQRFERTRRRAPVLPSSPIDLTGWTHVEASSRRPAK